MRPRDVRVTLATLGLAVAVGGCLPPTADLDSGPLTTSFAVSDYFAERLHGRRHELGSLVGQVNEGCKTRPDGARGNCYVFTYYTQPKNTDPWAGVYWVFPANNWGSVGGRAVDTTKFQQIRFSAAVEAPQPFSKDGVPGSLSAFAGKLNPMGTYDLKGKTSMDGEHDHIDAFDVSEGFVVGAEMKTFHIPITDDARSGNCAIPETECANGAADALIGAFGFSVPYPTDGDPTGASPVKIFLDDIVWDTEPAPSAP